MLQYKAPYCVREWYHPGGAAVKAALATPVAQRTQAQLETLWEAQQAERAYGDRGLAFSHRCEGDEIEGLFTIYGVVDGVGDRAHHGMFKHIRHLRHVHFQHNHDRGYGNLARIKAIWEIDRPDLPVSIRMRYPEAEGGAVAVWEYLDTENGQAARSWLKTGRLSGMSYQFRPVRARTTTQPDGTKIRDLYEVELHEISQLADTEHPCVPGTLAFTGNSAGSILEGNYQWRRF